MEFGCNWIVMVIDVIFGNECGIWIILDEDWFVGFVWIVEYVLIVWKIVLVLLKEFN